jgi:hypothetical protein
MGNLNLLYSSFSFKHRFQKRNNVCNGSIALGKELNAIFIFNKTIYLDAYIL